MFLQTSGADMRPFAGIVLSISLIHRGNSCVWLWQANPTIEPDTVPSFVTVQNPSQLKQVLSSCKEQNCRLILSGDVSSTSSDPKTAPKQGSQLLHFMTADDMILQLPELPKKLMQDINSAGYSYPLRCVFSKGLRPERFTGHIEFKNVVFAEPAMPARPLRTGLLLYLRDSNLQSVTSTFSVAASAAALTAVTSTAAQGDLDG